jgi:hypothetical protein
MLAGLGSGGVCDAVAPAVVAFAADPCPFTALRGEDVGVTCIGIAPPQVSLQSTGGDDVVRARVEAKSVSGVLTC